MTTATSGRGDAGAGRRGEPEIGGREDAATRRWGDAGTRGREDDDLMLPFVLVAILILPVSLSPCLASPRSPRLRVSVSPRLRAPLRVSVSPCPRVPASPCLRVPASPRPRVPASALRSLIEREASFTIEVVKVLRLDEIETRTRHALEQCHDLIMRD